jgi:hypothetical protein
MNYKLAFMFLLLPFTLFPQIYQKPIPKCVDLSISKVFLRDTSSSVNVLDAENLIISWERPPFFVQFLNKRKTQILTCHLHPGDYLYSIAEFQVGMQVNDGKLLNDDSTSSNIPVLGNINSFNTGKDIELGTSYDKIINALGNPDTSYYSEGFHILYYELKNPQYYPKIIDTQEIRDFFDFYNSPSYYGLYKFRDHKLFEYAFGFPYP